MQAVDIKQGKLNRAMLMSPLTMGTQSAAKVWEEISFTDFAHLCGIHALTPQQFDIACFCFDGQRRSLNIPAGHGVGKSLLAALVLLYHTMVKHGLCIVTAPTARQVSTIIFREANNRFSHMMQNHYQDIKRIYGLDLKNRFARGVTFLREIDDTRDLESLENIQRRVRPSMLEFDDRFYESLILNPKRIEYSSSDEFEAQVSEEMNVLHQLAKMPIGNTLGFAYGYTAKANDTSAFQGIHHRAGIKAIVDEASGVSDEIMEGVLACITGSHDLVLSLGNPTARNTAFHRACQREQYVIDVFGHPNIKPHYRQDAKGNYILKDRAALHQPSPIDGAVSPGWIESVRREYGSDSLYWRTRVEAKFPLQDEATDRLFNDATISRCFLQEIPEWVKLSDLFEDTCLYVGIDIGRVIDQSAITFGFEIKPNFNPSVILPGVDPSTALVLVTQISTFDFSEDYKKAGSLSTNYVKKLSNAIALQCRLNRINPSNCFIALDNTSQSGSELGNKLLEIYPEENVFGVSFSGRSDEPGFANQRAAIAYRFLKAIQQANLRVYTPSIAPKWQCRRLQIELECVRYHFHQGDPSKLILNPKEQIVKEIQKRLNTVTSPDVSDSGFLMAHAMFASDKVN